MVKGDSSNYSIYILIELQSIGIKVRIYWLL